jgi:K+-transporting ATPase ATPase C chain
MRKDLIRGSLLVLGLTVILGLLYPLAMTGVAQVLFPGKADGSLIHQDGKVVGSTLLASDVKDSPRYFHPRPSVTDYSASVTYFANRGPNQAATRDLTWQHLQAYLSSEGPYNPGLTAAQVPVDAATFSASGVDPHISKANARIQARRVAKVRGLSPARVQALIDQATEGRALGIFGDPGVNVTKLNHALDQEAA